MSSIGPRSIAAGMCLVIATLLLPIGLTGFWGQRTLTDTDQFLSTVEPLASDPHVIDTIAQTVTAALMKNADLDGFVDNYVPEGLQPLTGKLTEAVPKLIYEVTVRLLSTERFQQIWTSLAGDLQQATISALEGNADGPVSEQDGQIVLDVGEVIEEVKQSLVDQGLTGFADQPTPDAADRQIVLMNAEQVDQAQRIYLLTKPAASFLIFVSIGLFVLAALVAHQRLRMLAYVGLGCIVGAVLLRIGLAVAPQELNNSFAGTPLAATAGAFFASLTAGLSNAANMFIVLGVVLAAGGFFASYQADRKAASLSATRLR